MVSPDAGIGAPRRPYGSSAADGDDHHRAVRRFGCRVRKERVHVERRYRKDALVLESHVETREGAATLVDFMPPRGRASHVVRLAQGRRGTVAMRTEFNVRFDYSDV